MKTNDGDGNLINALELVARMGHELNGLTGTLTDLFQEELAKLDTTYPCQLWNKHAPKNSHKFDESGWLCTDSAESFALNKRRGSNNEADAYLGYQISLLGDGLIPGMRSPVIHVFLWEGAADFDSEGGYQQFPMEASATCTAGRIFKWGRSGATASWFDGPWTFSIMLTSMNSRQDLIDSVVRPALALLRGTGVMEALPDSLPGLVLYPPEVITNAE